MESRAPAAAHSSSTCRGLYRPTIQTCFVPQSPPRTRTARSYGRRNRMRIQCVRLVLSVLVAGAVAGEASAMQAAGGEVKLTRTVTVISSAGARALADACTAWAQQNKLTVAMARRARGRPPTGF